MRKVTKEDLKIGLEVRWYMHGRKYVIEDIKSNTVKFRGFDYFMMDSVLENCYVPKSKVMRFTSNAWKFLTQWKNYNVTDGKSGYYDLLDDNAVMVTVSRSLFEEPSLQREAEEFGKKITDHVHDYCKEAFGEHRDTMLSPQMQCRSVFHQIGGIKHDQDKIKPTLLLNDMPLAIQEVLKVLQFGAEKYSEGNWLEVNNGIERYRNASLRHALAQDEYDEESGLLHLAHEATSVLMLLELKLKEKQNAK